MSLPKHRQVLVHEPSPGARLVVAFDWDHDLLARVRTIADRRWHARRRCWTVPGGEAGVARLLEVFGPERVVFAETPTPEHAPHTALLARFEEELQLHGYSPRTRKAYLSHLRRCLLQVSRTGDVIGFEDLRGYLLALATQGYSRAYHAQAASALRFFAGEVLKLPRPEYTLPRPKRERKLPRPLTAGEARRLLAGVGNLKHRAQIALLLSSGVRVSELVRLRLDDLDSERDLLLVRGGKGSKDRWTLYGRTAAAAVHGYIAQARPRGWLFPGPRPDRHGNVRSVQKVVADAGRQAGITRPVSPHTLRHTFATQLREAGTDISVIQMLLGHASVATTMFYTHVSKQDKGQVRSPLDRLVEGE